MMRRSFYLSCLLLIAGVVGLFAVRQYRQAKSRGLELGATINRPIGYGLNVELGGAADESAYLASVRQAGLGWVRQTFNWQTTDWQHADSMVQAIAQNDLKLLAVLDGDSPPDPQAFARFAAEFADRYGDTVDYYQIWDEPNIELGWNAPPNAADYAALLQQTYIAIHAADPTATVLLAGLAPTTDHSARNISDITYLRQLYALGAAPYFDGAAGKPYGFNTSPADRTTDPNTLNFSRLILLREEMLAHSDGEKFLWASHFGWSDQPSIWGHVSAEEQVAYARQAFARAQSEWPWAGVLFLAAHRPALPADDPHWALAVDDLRSLGLSEPVALIPGAYAANSLDAYATFTGDWEFSELGADIPQSGTASLTFDFVGTGISILARRADYRAYLYATVDGQPANALPQDSDGQSYLILTSPDLTARVDTLPLASALAPGLHTLTLRPDRGWDQWAIVGFEVAPDAPAINTSPFEAALAVLSVAALVAAVVSARRANFTVVAPSWFARLGEAGQMAVAATISALVWASSWLAWGNDLAQSFRKYGDSLPLWLTAVTAGALYFSPALMLALAAMGVLLVLFYLRPHTALPLIIFFAPFYLMPRELWDKAFSMVEIITVLGVAATLVRLAPTRWRQPIPPWRVWLAKPVLWLDAAVAAFALVAAASAALAEVRGVALREFRVVVLEPSLFYFLLRAMKPNGAQLRQIVMAFIIGAVVVALIGLGNLITGDNLITAEAGLPRIRSVFGSPNNLALYLERALPFALSLFLLGNGRTRWLAGVLALPLAAAIALSFSKGALLLGAPVAVVVVLLFWGGRRAIAALGALAVLFAVALVPLSRIPRFADLFNLASGTSFFRVQLWRSAWAMFLEHPLFGVGLDNFLYAYRGRYILPEAWQEPNLPHAHNILFDALTRTGAAGLLALSGMLSAFAALIRKSLQGLHRRPLAVGALAAMAAALAHGMVDTAYWFVDLAFVWMLLLGIAASLANDGEARAW